MARPLSQIAALWVSPALHAAAAIIESTTVIDTFRRCDTTPKLSARDDEVQPLVAATQVS